MMFFKIKWCFFSIILLIMFFHCSVITLADSSGFDFRFPFSDGSPLNYGGGIKYKNIAIEISDFDYHVINYPPDGTLNPDWTYIKDKKLWEDGVDLLYFYQIEQNLQLYFGLGKYEVFRASVYKDNNTNEIYHFCSDTVSVTAYSIGIQYYLNRRWGIGGGYHSVRGLNGCLSITFY